MQILLDSKLVAYLNSKGTTSITLKSIISRVC